MLPLKVFLYNLFRLYFGWDKIEYEVVRYALDVKTCWTDKEIEDMKDLPTDMKNMPVSLSVEVSEDVFRKFLSEHADDFDISDNVNAQVPSFGYL